MSEHRLPERDRPWVMRTYAGHSTAKESNELYRRNLAKGQTGLSIAFDLPTQTGYDPDHELSRGEVGKVGVSIAHKGDMHTLLDGIPLDEMNTSMTINATAAWLLALYMTVAEENGVDRGSLQGTTQNDIIKEFLSRGTYAFPPEPSMRLIADMIAFTVDEVPKWNPINICSYHLQEAGATPVQEIAYALSTAQAVLDAVRARVPEETFPRVFGRISFFVNAGIRFVEEHAKLRAMGQLWEEIGRERYGVDDERLPALPLRRAGQLARADRGPAREQHHPHRAGGARRDLGRDARARALQLPAWNEALGLPRPWDQQWSLRIQQILAYETDLLEYPDIFEGSKVMEGLVEELVEGARAEMAVVAEHGGAVEAVPYMKTAARRVAPRARAPDRARRAQGGGPERLHRGRALAAAGGRGRRDPARRPGGGALGRSTRWRRGARRATRQPWTRRSRSSRAAAVDPRRTSCRATLAAAPRGRDHGRVGGGAARGVRRVPRADRASATPRPRPSDEALAALRDRVERVSEALGRRVKILVGKPGLDGHSNGAEQIAVRARDAGMDVVYEGIRLTPARIARTAVDEGVHVVGPVDPVRLARAS